MVNPIVALGNTLDKSVERISEIALASVRREEPKREPSRQQRILKAVSDGRSSPAELEEAREFRLVKDVAGQVELTPLGRYILSGYPEDDPGHEAKQDAGNDLAPAS